MKKIMAATAVAAALTGCISVNQNDGGESCMKQRIVKDVIHEKLAVDQNQVSGSDQIHCLFGFICWGSTAPHIADVTDDAPFGMVAKAKNGAYAAACASVNCDQVVATRYKVTTDDYFVYAKCKAEVKGYPARVVSVDVIEDKDVKHASVPGGGFGLPGGLPISPLSLLK